MRRVLLHLGLHKTGTTAAQSFLFENRSLIWPHYALVLPYRTREYGLSRAATNYSTHGSEARLDYFRDQTRSFLETLEFGEKRGLILSEENFSGLRPSRNAAQGYGAAPELAASLVEAVRHRLAGQEVEITLYLSLRQRDSWLRSLWAHDLQHMRQIKGFQIFCDSLAHLPPLQDTVDQIRARLPDVTVLTGWLEELQSLPFGPGAPFATYLNLRPQKAQLLVPPTKSNPRLPDDVLVELLELNRSRLDDAALVAQKATIVKRAQQALVSTT